MNRQRPTAVILKDGKLLLLRRIRPGLDYFIFPGGGVDEGETLEEALEREVREELTLEIKEWSFLFTLQNILLSPNITIHREPMDIHFFLVTSFTGIPQIGGPEKERMNDENQYHVAWIPLNNLLGTLNIYPEGVVPRLLGSLESINHV